MKTALHFDAAPEPGDFFFGSILGQGSYAKVFHAQLKKNKVDVAVKVMDQKFIRRENKSAFVITERRVLSKLSHPRIVKFYCSFRDNQSLYMTMELCRGGDLSTVIRKLHEQNVENGLSETACSFSMTQFYVAELVEALEYIHSKHIVHRDLKPDNLLLSAEGHLKVTDFGTAKDDEDPESQKTAFCGTVSYLSPEVLNDKPATKASDLWALGCIIFQMLTGRPPLVAENDYLTFQLINQHTSDKLEFPESIPEVARDLIRKLLVKDPEQRLGAGAHESSNGYGALKRHKFFDGIDWMGLSEIKPPFQPPLLELSEPRLDGAHENWCMSEYFNDDAFSECTDDSNRFSTNSRRSSRRNSSARNNMATACLSSSESIQFQSKVKLHTKMFKRPRQLVLTNQGRLLMLSTWSGKLKQEIHLTSEAKCRIESSNTFDIISLDGTFRFTDPVTTAQVWTRFIQQAIAEKTRK